VVVLSWGEPEDDGGGEIQGYRVYRGDSLLGEVEGREYRDENMSVWVWCTTTGYRRSMRWGREVILR